MGRPRGPWPKGYKVPWTWLLVCFSTAAAVVLATFGGIVLPVFPETFDRFSVRGRRLHLDNTLPHEEDKGVFRAGTVRGGADGFRARRRRETQELREEWNESRGADALVSPTTPRQILLVEGLEQVTIHCRHFI